MQQQKRSKVIPMALLALAAVAAYILATPAQQSTSAARKPAAKSSLPVASSGDQFTADDLNAHFPKLDVSAADVFKPLVYHATAVAGATGINAIPPEDANNEPGWAFTGIVGIDGANQASFQNDKTGEFAQVGVGQHWKTSTISLIGADNVTITGPDGAKTIPLPAEVATAAAATVAANTPAPTDNTPVMPGLNGAIGTDASNGQDQLQISGGGAGFGGGGWGGGRRGRGGGGRGGFGGGGRRGGGGGPGGASPGG